MSRLLTVALCLMSGLMIGFAIGCKDKPNAAQEKEDHSQHGKMGHAASGAEQAAELILTSTPEKPRAGESANLRIMLHDANGKMLKDFEPTHEKLAHLIIIREGLDVFAHLHPEISPAGMMTIKHTFPQAGKYFVFLDHKPRGQSMATSKSILTVDGDVMTAPTLVPNVPGTLRGDQLQAKVALRTGADKSQVLSFAVQDDTGKAITDLQPYLGAMGHLVIVSADGAQYVHAHPLTEKSPDGNVEFEVHFPGPGIYKAWGQFQRDGKVVTIPAIVKIDAAGHQH